MAAGPRSGRRVRAIPRLSPLLSEPTAPLTGVRLLGEALPFRGRLGSRLGAIAPASLAREHIALAYRFDGLWSYWRA
jgi:hypothetical protein